MGCDPDGYPFLGPSLFTQHFCSILAKFQGSFRHLFFGHTHKHRPLPIDTLLLSAKRSTIYSKRLRKRKGHSWDSLCLTDKWRYLISMAAKDGG
jgi:hypothetical protein